MYILLFRYLKLFRPDLIDIDFQSILCTVTFLYNGWALSFLKVTKFQNEFMKSSFLPKCEQNNVRIYALYCATLYRVEVLTIFCSYFGKNDDFINSF